MPGPAFAVGDAVTLHPIRDEDGDFLQYGRNHPGVRRPLADPPIRAAADLTDAATDRDYHFLACTPPDATTPSVTGFDEERGERVGAVGFSHVVGTPKRGDLMYWIAPEHQGHGYVTDAVSLLLDHAFRDRDFRKVTANVVASNDASAAVLEKLEFQQEGVLRSENYVDGSPVDAHRYGLLADEWRAD
jgi:RimJ/RimL family protein N-acetyltransferase